MRLCLTLSMLLLALSRASAQCPGVQTTLMPFAKERLTISTTVIGLTRSIYKPTGVTPSMAIMSIEGGTVRYEVIGTPTSTEGHPVLGTPATTMTICGLPSLDGFKVLSLGTDASLFITYYKPAP